MRICREKTCWPQSFGRRLNIATGKVELLWRPYRGKQICCAPGCQRRAEYKDDALVSLHIVCAPCYTLLLLRGGNE